MRPKRFSRSSYARRAARLADDLEEWATYYRSPGREDQLNWLTERTAEKDGRRQVELQVLANELRAAALHIQALV